MTDLRVGYQYHVPQQQMPSQTVVRQVNAAARNWCDGFSDMRQGYEGAQESRFLERPKDMPTPGAGHDYHIRDEWKFHYMIEYARHIENNDPVVSQGVERFVDNVVQSGYAYAPDTGIDRIDRTLEERWLEHTDPENQDRVDLAGTHNWHDYERLSVRRMVFDGDMGIMPLADGRLQAFEAHRIRSPIASAVSRTSQRRKVIHGVEVNNDDQPTRYWVTKEEYLGFGIGSQSTMRDVVTIRARAFDDMTGRNEKNFFHLYSPKRFSQFRGVTALAPVLNTTGMHADVQFAKLVQQQMVSYVGFTHEIPMSADHYNPPPVETFVDPTTGQLRAVAPDMSPGAEYWPQYQGEKITPFTANVPNAEFFDQARMLLTFISCNLGMPLILFLLDASETNFSSWRGAVEQAKLRFKAFQDSHATRLHRPTVRFQIRRWLRQDSDLRRAFDVIGPDLFRHHWEYPRWPYVQPLEDVKADSAEISATLNSPRRVAARRNLRYADVVRESCEDRSALILCAIDHANELNRHPYIVGNPDERITWREVAHHPIPDGMQMQILDKNSASSNEREEQTSGRPNQPRRSAA